MKTLEFTKEFHAPIQKVWNTLWDKDTYPTWTNAFNPNGSSIMQSDGKVGGKTLFLDGKGNGMISTITVKNEPYDMVFKHLGELKDGIEDTTSDKIKQWSGSLEEYHLKENNGVTTLIVKVQTDEAWAEMLQNGFEKGLEVLNNLVK